MRSLHLRVTCAALASCAGPGFERSLADLVAEYGSGSVLTGRVVDTAGAPIADARVHAGVYTIARSTASDDAGRFAIGIGSGYPNGTPVHVNLRASAFVPLTVPIDVGAREAVVVLDRGFGLRGQPWRTDWTTAGAVPQTEGVLAEREIVRFRAWARPGAWRLELVVRGAAGKVLGIAEIQSDVPEPAKGTRSGEFELGKVAFRDPASSPRSDTSE